MTEPIQPKWTNADLKFMRRAFDLALQGTEKVGTHPLVGCIIVTDGKIVGEGFFSEANVAHAEAIALKMAGLRALGATAYVSLEPHGYHSRTPPCTDALIRAGIKRVVVPIADVNPSVSGKGFEQLRRAGIEVCVGILARQAEDLNKDYIQRVQGRPHER